MSFSTQPQSSRPFHVMTKPAGPWCNLNCEYCFYLEKADLFGENPTKRMSDEVLENYVRQYIASQPTESVTFAWQGGEPTLLGVPFFEKVIELQRRYGDGHTIENTIQTNGTLLNDRWGQFLAEHRFLVGISVDGPPHLHDLYRRDRGDRPTFAKVERGLRILQRYQVEFNTLTVVNRQNAAHPKEVYRFLKGLGSRYLQFIPLVERECGHHLSGPPQSDPAGTVTSWSVDPVDYGRFLVGVFRHWVKHDVGKVYVQTFDTTLGSWVGAPSSLCIFAPECGDAVAMEHNGDVYACDHYVYPDYRLGNLMDTPLSVLARDPAQQEFGRNKRESLPRECRECPYLFACNGGCPKHRIVPTDEPDHPLNYLCKGYRLFFRETAPYFETMRDLYQAGRPPAGIMKMKVRPAN